MALIKFNCWFQVVVLLSWTLGCAAPSSQQGGFPAAAARLLRRVRLPPERLRAVPHVVRDLERMLQPHWPGCQAVLFGSVATGLAVIQSDVDVLILFPNDSDATYEELVTETSNIMKQHPELFEVISLVLKTTHPIVTAKHVPTGFNLDVSFKNPNGYMNSKFLRYVLNLDERVMDLALIVKYWARLQGITRKRLLPNYGIITMLIFYLQQKEILPTVASLQKNTESHFVHYWNMGFTEEKYLTKNNESLCSLLGGFFEYYSNFDYNNYMISTYAGRPIEINLFKDVNTVPEVFDLYKINVGLNITNPLWLKVPIVQDSFKHNVNLAIRVDDSIFAKSFQYATMHFQKNCTYFLETLLIV